MSKPITIDLTAERERLHADGRDVHVTVGVYDLFTYFPTLTSTCDLCGAPAVLSVDLDQVPGKCATHVRNPDADYPWCGCYGPHRSIERSVCPDCIAAHAAGLYDALQAQDRGVELHQAAGDAGETQAMDAARRLVALLPDVMRALGYDDATIGEAVANYRVLLSAKVTGYRVA